MDVYSSPVVLFLSLYCLGIDLLPLDNRYLGHSLILHICIFRLQSIAREFLSMQHGHLDSHEATFLFFILFLFVGRFILYNDVHLEL